MTVDFSKDQLHPDLAVFLDLQAFAVLTLRIDAAMATKIHFTPRPIMKRKGWYVQIIWPGGGFERIGVFKSKRHSQQWINEKSAMWMATRCHWMGIRLKKKYRLARRGVLRGK
jgi:hypothetical protein